MPHINIFLIPFILLAICSLVALAFTNFRGFLLFAAIVAALVGVGWVICKIATVLCGVIAVLGFLCLCCGSLGTDLLNAFFIHSLDPGISIGEAYIGIQSDLL